jgi:hypothetical protein
MNLKSVKQNAATIQSYLLHSYRKGNSVELLEKKNDLASSSNDFLCVVFIIWIKEIHIWCFVYWLCFVFRLNE